MIEIVRATFVEKRQVKMSITFKKLVGLGIVLVFCVIGLSAAQNENSDLAREEEALRNACPAENEIFSDFEYRERYDMGISNTGPLGLWCSEVGIKRFQCPDNPNDDYLYDVDAFVANIHLYAADAFASKHISAEDFYSDPERYDFDFSHLDEEFEIYDGLPIGMIQERIVPEEYRTVIEYVIIFWKNSGYSGNIWVYTYIGNWDEDKRGCTPSYQERVAEAKTYARSECERLAKLTYDRLPDDEVTPNSQYEELRRILVIYGREPLLWGDKENATKALKQYESPNEETFGYPTNKLLDYMLPEIIGVETIADMPEVDCSKPLYERDTKWINTLSPVIPSISGLLPGDNLKTYCELVKNGEKYAVEKFIYTGIIERAYGVWVSAHSAENSIEAIKNVFASIVGFYAITESSELYKNMSEDEFYNRCFFNFRERHNCEKSQSDIQYVKEHKKDLINKIIIEYNPTLVKIEDTIETLQMSRE